LYIKPGNKKFAKSRFTVFARLFAAAYNVFVSSFRAAYSFLIYIIERYRRRLIFAWLRFVDQTLFASREWLWWAEGSCSCVSVITKVTN